jgi:hypothetical protein
VANIDERPKLLVEHEKRGRIDVKERLEGDRLAALAVVRLVDGPHRAARNAANDFVTGRSWPIDEPLRGLLPALTSDARCESPRLLVYSQTNGLPANVKPRTARLRGELSRAEQCP